jgi:hypothetical protein
MHDATFINWTERLNAILQAGIKVIDTMVWCGMNDAGAAIFGDEVGANNGR